MPARQQLTRAVALPELAETALLRALPVPRATLPADIGGGLEAPVSRLSRHMGIGASSSGHSVTAVALEPVRAEECALFTFDFNEQTINKTRVWGLRAGTRAPSCRPTP